MSDDRTWSLLKEVEPLKIHLSAKRRGKTFACGGTPGQFSVIITDRRYFLGADEKTVCPRCRVIAEAAVKNSSANPPREEWYHFVWEDGRIRSLPGRHFRPVESIDLKLKAARRSETW